MGIVKPLHIFALEIVRSGGVESISDTVKRANFHIMKNDF